MEPVWPRAALEQHQVIAIRRGLLVPLLAAAAVALCPDSANAHLADFILAKVTAEKGRVDVELTADCSGGSMIASEAEAREVLGKVLRVRANGGSRELGALAPLQFERRTQIDPAAPVPRDPGDDARPHRLLSATWSWAGEGKTVAFEVPADAGGQSVILWTPAAKEGEQPRWVMLLSGDVSPEIAIPARPVGTIAFGAGAGVLVVGAGVALLCRRKRQLADEPDQTAPLLEESSIA